MKGLLALSLASALVTCGAATHAADALPPDAATAQPRTPIDVDHTASIVGIQIGTRLAGFIFISTDGKHVNVSADECAQSTKCQGIMAELGNQGRTDLIHFEPSHEGDAAPISGEASSRLSPRLLTGSQSLPHRSLREIDIQGHQVTTETDLCPGQYRENVPETSFFLYCWGRKP